jgi:hypothetical protein
MSDLNNFKKCLVLLKYFEKRCGPRYAERMLTDALADIEKEQRAGKANAARIEQERLAAKARAARPNFQVIAADSATVRDMRASFIHDGHDPRRAHSLGT